MEELNILENVECNKKILVKEISEELTNYIKKELDNTKKQIIGIKYEFALEKTEELLKQYKKLKANVRLNEMLDNKNINYNVKEDKRVTELMNKYFTKKEIEDSIIQTNRKYKDTKIFLNFIDGVFKEYLGLKVMKDTEIRKRLILEKLYIQGTDQKVFIEKFYGKSARMFYTDKDNLIKDLAPFFFGLAGMKIML